MTVYISLLRGVNVGGLKILMSDLKKLYESLNYGQVRSYIQSGNLIFESSNENIKELEGEIEAKLENKYGLLIPVFIRTVDEFKNILGNNSFPEADKKNVYVTFLKEMPEDFPFDIINDKKDESERYHLIEREIYLFLPHGYGRTKISNNFFENKLKLPATTRTWKTVNRLHELAKSEY